MSNVSSKSLHTKTVGSSSSSISGLAGKIWPRHPLQAIVIAVGLFVGAQLLTAVVASIGLALYAKLASLSDSQADSLTNSTMLQFVTIGIAETLVVLGVFWLMKRRGVSLKRLGVSRPKRQDPLLAVAAFIVYYCLLVAATILIQRLTPGFDNGQKQDIGFDQAAGVGQLVMVFTALVICAPIAEEVLFRGFLFSNLRQRWSFPVAAVVTSVLFGAAHLAGGAQGIAAPLWSAGIDTLLLSLVLCYLREKTGRLAPSIMLHALKNTAAFILLFVLHVHQ